MLQETTQAAAAAGGNAASALTQMGVDHLLTEMMSDPGAYAVSWVVLITLLIMSAMSVYWIVINTFKN
ncbi:MAG TPA: MotA/TolQ/ExbB proton channel family protein, partial [Luteimonas sp.]|nr:MotA/TolQ/ExbB proton channel family protein [Luteimonas sp.]